MTQRLFTSRYLFPTGLFLLVLFYSSFLLQGLHLIDNDYNFWLREAEATSFPAVILQIFNPVLEDWNIDFRPTQVLTFKTLYSLSGYNAAGYYYFKSLALAAFVTVYFLFLRLWLNNTVVAGYSALFVAFASSTFTSSMWVSDFTLVSELLALIVFGIFMNLELRDPGRTQLFISLTLMVALTLICDRTKANGKLIPVILFLYIVFSDWRKLKRYGVAIAAMMIVVVPWKILIRNPVPFLYGGSGNNNPAAWQPASLGRFWSLFGADFEPLSLVYSAYPPVSVLAIIGFPLLYASIAALIFLKRSHLQSLNLVRLLAISAALNIVALMSYPSLPLHFQSRYAISVLAPLIPLLLLIIHGAAKRKWARGNAPEILIAALVITQLLFHTYHTYRARNDFPSMTIASGTLREYIANNFTNTWFYYLNGPVFAFRPTNDGNRFFTSFDEEINVVASKLPSGSSLYVISFFSLNEPFLESPMVFPGKSDSLYDRIFNSGNSPVHKYTFYLYKVKV